MDFSKEAKLMRAGADLFDRLTERMAGRDYVSAATWYRDLAWGIRLFVEQSVPYFDGENADSWTWVAEVFEGRAPDYDNRGDIAVPWDDANDDPHTVPVAVDNVETMVEKVAGFLNIFRVEHFDLSGLLPSGRRGLTKGEAIKLSRMFTTNFWRWKYDRIRDPNYGWLKAVHDDLMEVQRRLGEPFHAGDLGSGDPGGGMPPISMPGGV